MNETTAPVRRRRDEALELRVSGKTYQEIGDILGLSTSGSSIAPTAAVRARWRCWGRCRE